MTKDMKKSNFRILCDLFAPKLLTIFNILDLMLAVTNIGLMLGDIKLITLYGEGKAIDMFVTDVVVLVASVSIIPVAVFGIRNTLNQNAKHLHMYSVVIALNLTLLTAVIIFMSQHGNVIKSDVTEWLTRDFFRNATGPALEQKEKLWDDLQSNFLCCGVEGAKDYDTMQKPMSLSCCPAAYHASTEQAQKELYENCVDKCRTFKGCKDSLLAVVYRHEKILVVMGLLNFCFKLSCFAFSNYLIQFGPFHVVTVTELSKAI
ncbi:uncharacterized protein [Epargyreus clarus]|uniref:uncharacterized protein n=1 Tax=Epargyreus clarus TaxID=520877 RepID=UPI003C3004CE